MDQNINLDDSNIQHETNENLAISATHLSIKTEETSTTESQDSLDLLYKIDDAPPWYTSVLLAFQQYFLMVESTVSIPYVLTGMMCMDNSDPARGAVASTIIFASGIITLMQATFGIRLPIIQGGTHTMLLPAMFILEMNPCPSDAAMNAMSPEERQETWQQRMQHIQGAICAAAAFQILVGFFGVVGYMMKWITPLVITPTISLVGLSMFQFAAEKSSTHWLVSFSTVLLIIIFSLYLNKIEVPIPYYSFSRKKIHTEGVRLFALSAIILPMLIMWAICFILTQTEVLSPTNAARTDLHLNILTDAPWVRVPYPCQWGIPTVTLAGFMGMLAGVITSVIESIGDYSACARLCGVPVPPKHAVNRGIFVEGIGTVVAGLLGTGSGTSSYSGNICSIAVTKVGSLRVIQYCALVLILMGVVGKVGAVFVLIPEPIIGGLFLFIFSLISAVGLSSLQYTNLNSPRNLFILGFSLLFGLALPGWLNKEENVNIMLTSYHEVDEVLFVLLKTPMFVGGGIGFILDNTVPGTIEERGIKKWNDYISGKDIKNTNDHSIYNLPFLEKLLKKNRIFTYFPISPTYDTTR